MKLNQTKPISEQYWDFPAPNKTTTLNETFTFFQE